MAQLNNCQPYLAHFEGIVLSVHRHFGTRAFNHEFGEILTNAVGALYQLSRSIRVCDLIQGIKAEVQRRGVVVGPEEVDMAFDGALKLKNLHDILYGPDVLSLGIHRYFPETVADRLCNALRIRSGLLSTPFAVTSILLQKDSLEDTVREKLAEGGEILALLNIHAHGLKRMGSGEGINSQHSFPVFRTAPSRLGAPAITDDLPVTEINFRLLQAQKLELEEKCQNMEHKIQELHRSKAEFLRQLETGIDRHRGDSSALPY